MIQQDPGDFLRYGNTVTNQRSRWRATATAVAKCKHDDEEDTYTLQIHLHTRLLFKGSLVGDDWVESALLRLI